MFFKAETVKYLCRMSCRLGRDSPNLEFQTRNVAIANALQLEVARATLALSGFNYDAMPSLKSLNLSIAVYSFCC